MIIPVGLKTCHAAWREAEQIGSLSKSIMKLRGNFVGILAEMVVAEAYRHWGAKRANTYEMDMIIGDKKIDVKAKRWAKEPDASRPVNVPEYSRQDCDAYLFTHVWWPEGDSPKSVLIAGWKRRDDFIDNSVLYRRGESKPCGWICSLDCREMQGGSLEPLSTLGEYCLRGDK